MKLFSSLLMSKAAAYPVDQVFHRVWFEEQAEKGLDYNTMKSNCAARGAAIGDTVGFPAFFRNQAEYDNFLSSVSDDALYIGYEQQNGDINQWLNADGTEVTFIDWDVNYTNHNGLLSQPDNAEEACVLSKSDRGGPQWHDFPCENNVYSIEYGYACRFETTKTADEEVLHRVWFEEQAETELDYDTMKSNCAARGAAISDTVGFPAFFRNQAEYENFLSSVSDDPLYLGYEQQNGDNNQWLNADGTEVTFTNWYLNQPNNGELACVVTLGNFQWQDFLCENRFSFKYACRFETTKTADEQVSTLIGGEPIAPAVDNLIADVKSSAYSSWGVSILCASDTLPFDGKWKSILHVTSGSDFGQIGSRVFAFWRNASNNNIWIGSPFGNTRRMFFLHACVANTYSTYKIVVSPDEDDSTLSIVGLYIDDVLEHSETVSARLSLSVLIGDDAELQVWAGKEWGRYGTATTYLIKDLTYTRMTRQCTKTLDDSEAFCDDGNFKVEVPLCAIEKAGIDPDDLFMNNANCRGSRDYDTIFFDAQDPNCAIVPTKNGSDWYIYEAQVGNDESASIISKHGGIEIDLSCAVNTHVNLDVEINVDIHFIVVGIDQDVGAFDVDMTVYSSSDFLVPVASDYTFHGAQKVYVGFKNEDSDLNVDILNCVTTPEEGGPVYPLIQDGIAVDPSTIIIESGTATEAKFEFEAFQFKGYPEFPVKVMCEIFICEPGNCN